MTAAGPAGAGGAAGAAARAEHAARTSYGRLLALVASRTGDIQLAEDSLGDAFLQALRTWPDAGVPANPDAWLLTVARNRQRDLLKSAAHRTTVADLDPAAAASADEASVLAHDAIPDRRLALLFVCAHPAIDPTVRAPLMLQTVLGLEARQVARAFVIPTSTMAQRLVRAKRRIREAGIPFVVPGRSEMPARLGAVLEAIYATYAIDWLAVSGTTLRESLAAEAHFLAVALAELLGDEPEAFGLAALISLSLARTAARGSPDGFVPLDEQDTALWDTELIARGERHLRRARAHVGTRPGGIGRFQIEAAIQSVHCDRAVSGVTDWVALQTLYRALLDVAPTLGARVAHAAAVGRVAGPEAGLAALDAIPDTPDGARGGAMRRFQPAWATRAHLLAEAGRSEEAVAAFDKAISLTTERGLREYLEQRRSAVRPRRPGG